jgi:hypothetical protein
MERVSRQEVIELLRRVGAGEVEPRLVVAARPWWEVYAGNVEYMVDGWRVEVFNDCNDWDYIDRVVAPDGRDGEYDDWAVSYDDAPDDEQWYQAVDDEFSGRYPELADAMERAFVGCRVSVDGTRADDPPPEVQGPPSPLLPRQVRAYALAELAAHGSRLAVDAAVGTVRAMVAFSEQDYAEGARRIAFAAVEAVHAKRCFDFADAIRRAGERRDDAVVVAP